MGRTDTGRCLHSWAALLAVCLGLSGCGGDSTSNSSRPEADAPAARAPKVRSTLVPGEGKSKFVTGLRLAGKTLWIATKSGLFSAEVDGAAGTLKLVEDREVTARFANQEFTALEGEGEVIAGGTAFGYARFEPAGGWSAEENGRVNAVAIHQGIFYVGRSTGIERFGASKTWDKLAPEPPIARNQTSAQHITALAAGKDGELWAGTKFGLLCANAADGKWKHLYGSFQDIKSEKVVTDEQGNCDLAGNFINTLRYDAASGKLLVGTDIGVSVLDTKENKWTSYTGDHTKYIVKDDNLVRVPVKGNLALPSCEIHAVAIEDSALWIGTKAGLVRLAGERLELFDGERGLPDDNITALAFDAASRALLVGTEGGVAVVGYE